MNFAAIIGPCVRGWVGSSDLALTNVIARATF